MSTILAIDLGKFNSVFCDIARVMGFELVRREDPPKEEMAEG